ncbi:hypothetical protein HYH03_010200 [Edaphochlamys debaryana]|uniref:methylated diphthine methylhydrolase n=1 Tax=Edaphochlamys debaryana TaxID=47281 RepID=A0A836BWE8_9CHLO|nr:hypothetical protein HYH03_010200 [Edaphochlamys debaryana]|eukprot:KAG2491410.1 hypothetical protein HYH03_010200 [Edaphochlamys debaryana]
MTTFQGIEDSTLDYCADAAEFCPVPGLTRLLALGTYQLIEAEQRRVGRCYLLRLTPQRDSAAAEAEAAGGDGAAAAGERAEQQHTSAAAGQEEEAEAEASGGWTPGGVERLSNVDVPGVFDIKWAPAGAACCSSGRGGAAEAEDGRGQRAVLGAALADGSVRLLEVADNTDEAGCSQPELHESAQVAAFSGAMALSLDWQGNSEAGQDRIATSSSAGTLAVIQVAEGGLTTLVEWEAHSLEAWCAAFHKSEPHFLFSGADDCLFRGHDLRSDPAAPAFTDRRTHSAGVCTISPHPDTTAQPYTVATGSYDESVRLWDVRNMARPVMAAQVNTGGGNWRLRWHPHDPHVLLAACMYNGFAVLRADEPFSSLRVVATYQSPNKHIGYGADWWQERGPASSPLSLASTCSFYDKRHTLVWLPTDGEHPCAAEAEGTEA